MSQAAKRRAAAQQQLEQNKKTFDRYKAITTNARNFNSNIGKRVAKRPSVFKSQIDVQQTKLGSRGLGEATKAAQQALSEKYGIPTFDKEGSISTVPKTRALDPSINVGTGRFTQSAFNDSLNFLIKKEQSPFDVRSVGSSVISAIEDTISGILGGENIDIIAKEDVDRIKQIDERLAILATTIPRDENILDLNIQANVFNHTGELERRIERLSESLRKDKQEVKDLQAERRQLINKSGIGAKFVRDIESAIGELKALELAKTFTVQLRAEAETVFEKNQNLLDEIAKQSIDIPSQLLTELGIKTRVIRQRFNEPIKEVQDKTQSDVKQTTDFLNMFTSFTSPLASIGELITSAIFPSPEDEITRLKQNAQSQVQAAKELREL